MSNIVTIGYITEGPTDKRFLETIIKKTVEEIAFNCEGLIDVYDPVFMRLDKTGDFINLVVTAAKEAFSIGVFILCVHVDSDDADDSHVINHKITPAITAIHEVAGGICKIIVPVIPITMSEAWMLADKDLFRSEIGTTLSDESLNINRNPESIANPKATIEEALRIAQEHLPKRRFKLTVGELYQPIGQKLSLEKLGSLNSFKKFRQSIEDAFKLLNYIH